MKTFVSPKSEKVILRTHPIVSKVKGWYIKIIETSNNVFTVEAIDSYGRIVSKQGNNTVKLQEEIETLIKQIKISA
ncbi:MAG: hypothetical protein M3525_02725 [Acidobacteriota bacterium]|nr:hypothetical protein [Acidobacteriota bacterium]